MSSDRSRSLQWKWVVRLLSIGVMAAVVVTPASAAMATQRSASLSILPTHTLIQETLLTDVQQIFISRCMARSGFKYLVASIDPNNLATMMPIGFPTVTWAKTFGTESRNWSALARNGEYLAALSTARSKSYYQAFFGSASSGPQLRVRLTMLGGVVMGESATGCQSTSARALYGQLSKWFDVSNRYHAVASLLAGQVFRSVGYRHAEGAWSQCMGALGSSYTSPLAVLHAVLATGAPPDPAILRSADCAKRVGLSEVARRLLSSEPSLLRMSRHYSAILVAFTRMIRPAFQKAKKILEHACGRRNATYSLLCRSATPKWARHQ